MGQRRTPERIRFDQAVKNLLNEGQILTPNTFGDLLEENGLSRSNASYLLGGTARQLRHETGAVKGIYKNRVYFFKGDPETDEGLRQRIADFRIQVDQEIVNLNLRRKQS